MVIVAEDGTGLTNANSYVDLTWVDSYFTGRGNTEWADATDNDKLVALIKATDYLDVVYNFVGTKASSTQALEWPRAGAEDKYGEPLVGIPTILKKAAAELALRALSTTLLDDTDFSGRVKRERVEGAVEVEYAGDGVLQQKTFTYVDKLLSGAGLVYGKVGSFGQLKIVRV